jgi:hypothetical protein
MKKPASVQFKFFEDLKALNAPTEPRTPIVQTMQIPTHHQEKLKKRVKKHRIPALLPLLTISCALAMCACLLLLIVLHH